MGSEKGVSGLVKFFFERRYERHGRKVGHLRQTTTKRWKRQAREARFKREAASARVRGTVVPPPIEITVPPTGHSWD